MADSQDDKSLLNSALPKARTWKDLAAEIVNEPESEKLTGLVRELSDLLDRVPKGPSGVRREDLLSKTKNQRQ
jgi:hypothetical protein